MDQNAMFELSHTIPSHPINTVQTRAWNHIAGAFFSCVSMTDKKT